MRERAPMKLVVTVDVEEDQWGITPPCQATVNNVYRLPILQRLFGEFGIVPTYLLTYPVVDDARAVGMLRGMLNAGGCEIGTHCHPWNTPPYTERLNRDNSMLCNLPPALQFEKLQRLHEAIQDRCGITPIAFRSGRWGFDVQVARQIVKLGYRVDTSVTPYTSWARESGPDFSHLSPRPYTYTEMSTNESGLSGTLMEVPVSIGYLHGRFPDCANLVRTLKESPFRRFKVCGLLSKCRLLRKVWLSPEMETPARMIRLVRQMTHQGYEVLNLVFHSSSLMEGCGPFVRTKADEQVFLYKLETLLGLVRNERVVFSTLREVAQCVHSSSAPRALRKNPSVKMSSVTPVLPGR